MTGRPAGVDGRCIGHDNPMQWRARQPRLSGEAEPDATLMAVRAAARCLAGQSVVLPATELSGFCGFPIIRWCPGVAERLAGGWPPMLDRTTLALWESWPRGVEASAPRPPLQIVGFASASGWHSAVRAAAALRGFGTTMVVTRARPGPARLTEADIAGVYVVGVDEQLGCQVLVHGRACQSDRQRRMVATRYWEERLFAHALAVGEAIPRPSSARS